MNVFAAHVARPTRQTMVEGAVDRPFARPARQTTLEHPKAGSARAFLPWLARPTRNRCAYEAAA